LNESVPRKLGRYRPIALIAKGGMGEAYLATIDDEGSFNRLVVVKVLREDLANEAEFVTMFRDEARVAAGLTHPNVVQTHEFGLADGHYYIVMDFVDGQPLKNLGKLAADTVPIGFSLRVLTDVLAGLQSVHDLTDSSGAPLGLVHRDVSPHNVMVSYDGHAKLLDFGISKSSASTHQTSTGILKGKLAYMAPEQARFEGVDHRVDLFAVGAMLWEVLYGRRMWDGVPDPQILMRLVRRELPVPPEESARVFPVELRAILLRAVSGDPAERYASANDFANDLETVIETLPRAESSRRGMCSLLAEHFGVQRERRRKIVEEAIAKASVAASTGEFQSIVRMAALAQTGETSSRIESITASESSVEREPSRSSSPALVATVGSPANRYGPKVLALAGLFAFVAAIAVASQVASGRAQSAAQAQSSAGSAAPLTQDTTLRVNVSPTSALAHVWLDGRELPFGIEVSVPKDGREHTLFVQAEGYARYVTTLRLDGPNTVQVSLSPVPSALATAPSAASSVRAGATVPWHGHVVPAVVRPMGSTAPPVPSSSPQAFPPTRPGPDDPAPHRPERPILDTLGK
jgi:eukaryotic-like serine/threonine-protein kinase